MIYSIGTVCAVDFDDSSKITDDNSTQMGVDDVGKLGVSNGDTKLLESEEFYGNHFYQLNDAISSLNSGDTLILKNDVVQDGTNYIEIGQEKSGITIDGENHVIDANNISAILYVRADSVILKNIKFINANNADNVFSGAICVMGNNIVIQNCTFEDNTAVNGGGVYFRGSITGGRIIDSIFIRNNATGRTGSQTGMGGAIFQILKWGIQL